MPLFKKNETGKPCQACGNATSKDDPAVRLADSDVRVHESHTTNPKSGLFGRPTK
ncbi:hypothetical protein [Streptomyces scabiei]|uniref:hypothetical protein n=1 Tax=Streptomyces scabiei TaxID=1930 RepID=UPI0029B39BCE|nr:hypothetical protein [Streptomyces scabiei]MDX3027506.1 hypothetical protein [Streptomyces scabiei]